MASYTFEETKALNNIENENGERGKTSSRKHFWRQMMVCSTLWTTYFVSGMITCAAPVLIPQLRKEANSTEAVTRDMASWVSSVHGLAGIHWALILPTAIHFIGRKRTFVIVCVIMTIGVLVFCASTSIVHILISQIIFGIVVVNNNIVAPAVLAEYSSSRNRGIFLTLKTASFFWGVWVSNAIGTFFHWRIIGFVSLASCIQFLSLFWWPDSPYWLASQGRFDECAEVHRWLKGNDIEMKEDLKKIISTQKEYLRNRKHDNNWDYLKNICNEVKHPEYYKPLFICILLSAVFHCSGKMVCTMYVIDIVKKITASEATAYKTMLILDAVSVFSMYLGCFITKIFKRRLIYFSTASTAILFLFTLALYLYLVKLNIIVENDYVSLSFLLIYTFAIVCGPIILSSSLLGEIMPVRYKSSMSAIVSVFSCLTYTFYLKLAPTFFRIIGLHGAFLLFGVTLLIILLLLHKYMPETKDITLQEIEEHFIKEKVNIKIRE